MDFKWTDRVDGVDPASANDINTVAHAVEALNEEIKSLPSGGGGGSGTDIKVPTKTSELENDSGFITGNDVPKKLSELEADSISRSDQEPFDFSAYIANFAGHEAEFSFDNLTFRNMGYGSGVSFDGQPLHDVGAPEADTDGANKGYVDNAVNGIPSWAKQPTKPTYTAAEVGAIAKNQGSANVGKILVVGSDGNLMLTDMPEGGGDVTGMVDEENNILLSGDLADGTYTLKYVNTDGTYSDVGTLVVGEIKPSYTNLLPQSVDANGNDFVGSHANGGDGYEYGYRISKSSGSQSASDGVYCTGFMPFIGGTDEYVYIKDISLYNTEPGWNNIVFYDSDKNYKFGQTINSANAGCTLTDGVWKIHPDMMTTTAGFAFFRFSAGSITDKTIVTVDEEIV